MPAPDPFAEPLRVLLSSSEGRDFARWLLVDVCGVLRSPMAETAGDIQYQCGKQDIGYMLIPHLVGANPSFASILMENRHEPD